MKGAVWRLCSKAKTPPRRHRRSCPTLQSEAGSYSSTGEMIKGRMPELVKGAGFAPKGGNMPLTDQTDILRRASQAAWTCAWKPAAATQTAARSSSP